MIARTVVSRPTSVAILFIVVLLLGVYSFTGIAVDLFPEINPPILVVITNYTGSGPQEVETQITRPLESALSNVSNIEKITSTSSLGTSTIQVNFIWGTDMAEAANEVRDRLEFVKRLLPEEAGTPTIFKFDPSLLPIMNLTLKGNRTPEELRELAERIVQPRLEQVEGVAQAAVSGGRTPAVMVEVPQNRLEAYNLTLSQIAQALRLQNAELSGGQIKEGNLNYVVRTAGAFNSLEEIKNTIIATRGTPQTGFRTIRLLDVATVTESYRPEDGVVYINGLPGVEISVLKQSGTNSVAVADAVLARLNAIQRELPAGVQIAVLTNSTNFIRTSLNQVGNTAFTGALLAVIILFLFLRNIKSTVIIAIAIPISVILTLMMMYYFGLTLNIMTLTGLVLGIGMLVDNSIVILENIYHYREKGTKPVPAAVLGTTEMILPISASTLTTIVVFLPIILFQSQLGIFGEFFKGLAFTVIISLVSSLATAILLVPVLSSKYLVIDTRFQRPPTGLFKFLDDAVGRVLEGMNILYEKSLRLVLKNRLSKILTILGVIGILVASFALIPLTGIELIPNQGQDAVNVSVELPVGTRLEVTKDTVFQLEEAVRRELDGLYENLIVRAGGRALFGLGAVRTNTGRITITLPPAGIRKITSREVQNRLRPYFNDYPSAVFSFTQGGGGGPGFGASPIDIVIKALDLDTLATTGLQILDLVKEKVPEVTEPKLNLLQGLPQLDVTVRRDRLSDLGLNAFSVGQEVRASIDGVTASRYRVAGREKDIVVILDAQDRQLTRDLSRIFLVSPNGQRVSLSNIADSVVSSGPVDILRENQSRTLHLTGGLAPGARLDTTVEKLRTLIRENIPADETVVIDFSGDFENFIRYGIQLLLVLLVASILVYGVMAAQFESFLDPFIIMFTIVLSFSGVFFIHWATQTPISLFTAVGAIMLVGIVVNNGIVLVDYTNLLRKRGLPLKEAVVSAGRSRLRPVLMTSLTTILGLLPLAFVKTEGTDLVSPIGKTILGGLATSTFLTLFIVPLVYLLFNTIGDKLKARALKKREKMSMVREAV